MHHLSFTDEDYKNLGSLINGIQQLKQEKTMTLWKGLLDNRLDIIATDHAPHTISEKQNKYLESPSGVVSTTFFTNYVRTYVQW